MSAAAVALLALGAAWLLPPLLAARTAYEEVFVPDAPRPVVTVNPRGTPEVVVLPTETPPPLPDWDRQERINVLLIGADTNSARLEAGEPALSDTLIIVTIAPVTRTVGLLSIPRDLLVTIPGVGLDKINAAFSIGSLSELTGPGLARATVEYNFGITIHYFAQVDFEGFQRIIDTLGGVTIDVPAPIKDDAHPGEGFNYTRIYFHTGPQHMDGKTALRYARTRHDDNDFARANRQQQILLALREQAVARNLIANARELLMALSDTVRTDIPPLDLLKLAKLGTEIQPQDTHSYSILPATYVEWNPPGPYLLIPDWEAVHEIVRQMIPPEPAVAPDPAAPVRPPAVIKPV
ncbi:MAG: LCP family protein [Sphaerobacter thermophilus]